MTTLCASDLAAAVHSQPPSDRRRERKAIMDGEEWIFVETVRERDGRGGWVEVRDIDGD